MATSFKDRFRDRAVIVGKDGQNAMIPSNAPPAAPQQFGIAKKHPQRAAEPDTTGSSSSALASGGAPAPVVPVGFGRPVAVQSQPSFGVGLTPMQHAAQGGHIPSSSVPQNSFLLPQPQMQNAPGQQMGAVPAPRTGSFSMPLAFRPTGVLPVQAAPSPPALASTQAPPVETQPRRNSSNNTVVSAKPIPKGAVHPLQAPAPQQLQSVPHHTTGSSGVSHGGVGAYNYNAAIGGPQTSSSNSLPQQDQPASAGNVVRYGRRAGSTDPSHPKKASDKSTSPSRAVAGRRANKNDSDDQRPSTDPQPAPKREIHYTPYSVEDYKRMKDELAKKVSGGLGPSDTDEQRAAAAKLNRQREYAENIKKINQLLLAPSPSMVEDAATELSPQPSRTIVQPRPVEVIEKLQRREKAREYAKHVPKPKPILPRALDGDAAPSETPHDALEMDREGQTRLERERRVADLEARHEQDQRMVENIKKQLRM